jgi:probable rRNA maturation factor
MPGRDRVHRAEGGDRAQRVEGRDRARRVDGEDRVRRLYRPPWRIDIVRRSGVPRLLGDAEVARLVAAALIAAGAPRPAAIGLILATDRELTDLNERVMGERGPTDVLSFPLLPPAAFPAHEGQDAAARADRGKRPRFRLPPGTRTHLGEIVISVERAIEQAEQGRGGQTGDRRWTPAHELRLLVVHGTLHVCGWDHSRPDEEAAMRALERRLLDVGPAG